MHISIPESIAQSIRLPEHRREAELLKELAITLYAQDLLSLGKAQELSQQDYRQFCQSLGDRSIMRHYSDVELREDLDYARR